MYAAAVCSSRRVKREKVSQLGGGGGYNLAAVVAAVRAADSEWTDTTDPFAPSGLVLPTATSGLTTVNVSTLSGLRSELASPNNKLINWTGGNVTESSSGTQLFSVPSGATNCLIDFQGATLNITGNCHSFSTHWNSSRIRIQNLITNAIPEVQGRDVYLYNVRGTGDNSASNPDTNSSGLGVCGHRVVFERCKFYGWNGIFFTGAIQGANFVASISGTTMTVTTMYSGTIRVGQSIVTNQGAGIASVSGNGTTITVTTNGAHPFTTGKKLRIQGIQLVTPVNGDANAYGYFRTDPANYPTITVTGPTTFTYPGTATAACSASTGFCNEPILKATKVTAFGTGSGGTGTYTVSRSQSYDELQCNAFERSTNLIVANSDLECLTNGSGGIENPFRVNGGHMVLAVDTRLSCNGKYTARIHPDFGYGYASGKVGLVRCQQEGQGSNFATLGGVTPGNEFVLCDNNRMYGPNDYTYSADALMGINAANYDFANDPATAAPLAAVTGDGSTITYRAYGDNGHGLTTGDTVTTQGMNTGFNQTNVTVTVLNDWVFTYPGTGSGNATGVPFAISTKAGNADFRQRGNLRYSAPTIGTNNTGLVPGGSGSPNASWTTANNATNAAANGNLTLTTITAPAWAHQ